MENRDRVLYRLVGTRGGVVLREMGSMPVYLESFLQKMQASSTVQTVRVRNDIITYGLGPANVYLVVYKEENMIREMEEAVEEGRSKTEKSHGAKVLFGIFTDKEESRENNKECEGEIDSDPEEEVTGWQKWKKPESILKIFTRRKEITEQVIQEHLLSRNIPLPLSKRISTDIVAVMKSEAMQNSDETEEEKLKKSFKKVVSEIVPTLSPDRIIAEIETHKKNGKGPYVFCMVGVNGVGKSTTLSKLCLWILKNKYRICVAACDGFRSGAIEQLKKYVERYQARGHAISLYEKGYKKDEASIANKAIAHAVEHKYDVVLIDTCGRMPGNTQAMLSLSKMIRVNRPNKIFYVGEALVGNDSIDQIKGFNEYIERACVDKVVDGIIVTKCDAVDEKVGTIISLANTVNKPVVFIGVGQKNVDLLPFDIDSLCEALYII